MRIAVVQTAYGADEPPLTELLSRTVADIETRVEDAEVDLVVLPELWATGAFRPRGWAERAETLDGPTVTAMSGLARRTGALVHLGSIVERDGAHLYNTAVVLDARGEIVVTYRKVHRFRAGGLEAELVEPGEQLVVVDLPLRDGTTLRTGLATCYDLRFPEMFRAMVDQGAEAFVVPASWPAARGRLWDAFLRARAGEDQALVIGAGATGVDGRTPMTGRSAVVDAHGEDIAVAGEEAEILLAETDPQHIREVRQSFPVLADRLIAVESTPRL